LHFVGGMEYSQSEIKHRKIVMPLDMGKSPTATDCDWKMEVTI
jgi:hypothetical protein